MKTKQKARKKEERVGL